MILEHRTICSQSSERPTCYHAFRGSYDALYLTFLVTIDLEVTNLTHIRHNLMQSERGQAIGQKTVPTFCTQI